MSDLLLLARNQLLPLALVIGLAIVLLFTQGIDTSADSLWYLLAGHNLATNSGYTHFTGEPITNRGPLFAWLISLGPMLTTLSITESAYLVMRLCFAINLVLIYLVGTALFKPWTGFVATTLAALTFSVHAAHSRIIIDPLVPLFVLLTMWLLLRQRPLTRLHAVLAGGALGLGFLAKEVVVVFVAAPFVYTVLVIARGRSWQVAPLVLFVLAFLLPIVLWLVFSGMFVDDPNQAALKLLGWAGPKVLATFGVSTQAPLLVTERGGMLDGLIRLYQEHLSTLGWLAPLALVAVVVNSLSLRRGHLLLTAFILCWMPVAIHIGMADLREGQSLVLIVLLLLALAAMMTVGVENLLRDQERHRIALGVSVVAGIALCMIHGLGQTNTHQLLRGDLVNRTAPFAWRTLFEKLPGVKQTHESSKSLIASQATGIASRVDRVHAALTDKIFGDAVFLTDLYYGSGLALAHRTSTNRPPNDWQFVNLEKATVAALEATPQDVQSMMLLLGPQWNPLRRNDLVILSAARLSTLVKSYGVTHIVLAGRQRQLAPMFEAHPAFGQVILPKRIPADVFFVTDSVFAAYTPPQPPILAKDLNEQLSLLRTTDSTAFDKVIKNMESQLNVDLRHAVANRP